MTGPGYTRHPAAAEELPVGAHLMTQRTGYIHHGIYTGDGNVVHYAGWCRGLRRGPVQQVSLAEFACGREYWVARRHDTRYTGDEVVRRARSRLGEDRYHLTTNNCEHFCAWCVTGEARSDQVDRWLGWHRHFLGATLGFARPILGTGLRQAVMGGPAVGAAFA